MPPLRRVAGTNHKRLCVLVDFHSRLKIRHCCVSYLQHKTFSAFPALPVHYNTPPYRGLQISLPYRIFLSAVLFSVFCKLHSFSCLPFLPVQVFKRRKASLFSFQNFPCFSLPIGKLYFLIGFPLAARWLGCFPNKKEPHSARPFVYFYIHFSAALLVSAITFSISSVLYSPFW